ncbi:hypothetical protein Dimus_038857 [Dionaea muscipula]
MRQNFNLHAALFWTINDFPAYGILSGWSTKGKLACPCCNKDTHSIRLANSSKQCYLGHRRWLVRDHRWRNDKKSFDGTRELRVSPTSLSGDDVLHQVHDLEGLILTKASDRRTKVHHQTRGDNWNKRSIFFQLPYWRTLALRHNLDVMHIEKNICDNILGTIMSIKGKNKDSLNARLDLKAMNIRPELHPIEKDNKFVIPGASYTLPKKEKHMFCKFLKEVKFPDGFSSNISRCVNLKDEKISGMKSHDCHIFLQHLLPHAVSGLLPKEVCEALTELSLFFNVLCSKTLKVDDLTAMQAQIGITLCKLERIFPPSFFDVMMHLPVHLANEAKLGGPVPYRSMWIIEQYLQTLKSYVRNRAHPEGSIAEGYIVNECMTQCSRYFDGIETKFNRLTRNDDCSIEESNGRTSIFFQHGWPVGASKLLDLERE